MNANTKLIIAGAILLAALAFYLFGEGLVNAPDESVDGALHWTSGIAALRG